MPEVDLNREVAEPEHTVEGLADRGNQEYISNARLEFMVPGLDAVASALQNAFPDLSRDSLARILGLPAEAEPLTRSTLTAGQKGGIER
jgi:hypothetical protein